MIRIWRGYHSSELLALVRGAYEREELLLLCPPGLTDFGFVELLPDGEIQGEGELTGQVFERSGTAPAFYEAPVMGVFTSGTLSGNPRLVLYSKRNLEAALAGIRSFFEVARFDTIFSYPQPFHTFGLVLGYVHAAIHGLKLVTGQGKYARSFHELRAELRSDSVLTLGTPTHFHDLLSHVRSTGAALAPSYTCILGGAKVTVSLWHSVRDELKISAPSIGYGATEASPGVTHQPPGRVPVEEGEIGVPIPGVSVRLVPDEGLEFQGPNVCLAIIEDGQIQFPRAVFLRDRIRARADGNLVFEGRLDLMLNRGGQKFSLERIEQVVSRVAQVEAVCVPLPDGRLGEELGILLKNGLTADPSLPERMAGIHVSLQEEFGQAFHTASWMQVEALPLNENSKVDRKQSARILMGL